MNYLQYIDSMRQEDAFPEGVRFLISGVDPRVRRIVGDNIIRSLYSAGLTLFVLDNTQSGGVLGGFGPYRIVDALSGEVSLCSDLLNVSSLQGISRLRSLLTSLGFDGVCAMKIVSYLKFVEETQRRLGYSTQLTPKTLENYGSPLLVEWNLEQLVGCGKLSQENYEYLMGRYSEVSGAAADFENFLVILAPFMGNLRPTRDTAVHLPFGEFASDKPMQSMLGKLLVSYIKQNPSDSALLILDDGNESERRFILDILKNIPLGTQVHMITNDAFTLDEADRNVLMNTFPIRIYTRHVNMVSCIKIENLCGEVDVVKHSSTVTVDRRFKANSAWDMLFGTNKTETAISNAPVKEARFRREFINGMCDGTGIIDCAGHKVMFSF